MKRLRVFHTVETFLKRLRTISPGLFTFLQRAKWEYFTWRRRRLKEEQYPQALKQWYFSEIGQTLDLENPKTFNEKIQWLKLYDSTPLKTELADKYKVRKWVAEKIGEEYLIPLLGKWENARDIDFDTLPDRFVLKPNHGAGWAIIVRDKRELNIAKARKLMNSWLKRKMAYYAFELHYKDIPPLLIAEKYIENVDGDVYDYKFLCFDGEPRYLWVDTGRHTNHKRSVFDLNLELQPFTVGTFPGLDLPFAKPKNYDQMVACARKLCEGFKHVRVDFYNIDGQIYFGEMTFTSSGGKKDIYPLEYGRILGDMIPVP